MTRYLTLFFIFLCLPIHAFSVLLKSNEIVLPGPPNTTLQVENNTPKEKAISISILRREHTPTGNEIRHKQNPEPLIAIPEQFILSPGKTQVILLRWTGSPTQSIETPYRVLIEETPLNTYAATANKGEKGAKVTLLLTYAKSLYITPKDSAPKITYDTASVATQKKKSSLNFTLKNLGNRRQIISALNLDLINTKTNKAQTLYYSTQDLEGVLNLLAGDTRELSLPNKDNLPSGQYKITKIDFIEK